MVGVAIMVRLTCPSPSTQFVRLYKDPKGDKLFTHVTRDLGASAIGTCDDQQVHTLQRKVKNLEAQLTKMEVSYSICKREGYWTN